MSSNPTTEFWSKADRFLLSTGVPSSPLVIKTAKGTKLHDVDGREILDFTSGQMSSLLGHSHPEIVEVIKYYAENLDHLLSNMVTQPVVDLAERLAGLLPAPLD